MQSIILKIISLGWQKLVLVGAVVALLGGLTSFYVVKNYRQGRQDPKNNLQATTKKPAKKLPTTQEQSESAAQDSVATSETPSQHVSVLKPSATKPSTESSSQPTSQSEPEPSSSSSNDHSASSGSSPSPTSSNQTPAQTTTPSPSSSQPAPTSSPAPTTPAESTDTCGNDVGNGNDIIAGPSGPSGSDNDSVFRSLTVHPTDAKIIYIGTERNGVLKSTDGGLSWTRLRKGFRHTDVGYPEFWDISVSSTNPSHLLAATSDSPGPITGNYPSSMAGIYRSIDGGQSWTRVDCGLTNGAVASALYHPTSTDIALAGGSGGTPSYTGYDISGKFFPAGLYRTTDAGANWVKKTLPDNFETNSYWQLVGRGTSPWTITSFAFNYDDLTKNIGFIRSTDGGQTWQTFASELRTLRITDFDVSADGQTIYAVPRDTFAVKKSTDGGTTWTTVSSRANGVLAISPSDANRVVFAAHSDLYLTTNGFVSETQLISGSKKFNDIVFAPSDPTIVYAVTSGFLLYKSTDRGAAFALIKNLRSDVLNAGG